MHTRVHAKLRAHAPTQQQALIGAGVVAALLLGVWYATPLPTEAARYAWRHWQAPRLALALDRTDAPLALAIGNTYFGTVPLGGGSPRYNPALAARAFREALAIDPHILWGHYSLARVAFVKKDFNTALDEIDAELEMNQSNQRALYVRGLIYGYRALPGDLLYAEADFKQFIRWAPSEWAGYNDLAWILAKEGKYQEAKQALLAALAKVPGGATNPWLLNQLGVAELNLGENAAARATFTKARLAAQKLTEADWRAAYSGDSPAKAAEGLAAFRAAIDKNFNKAAGP